MAWICLMLLTVYILYTLLVTAKRADERYAKAKKPMAKNRIGCGKIFPVVESQDRPVFKDYAAVDVYINYLFRTENRQEWTNVETPGNFCIWGTETMIHGFSEIDWKGRELELRMRNIFAKLEDGKDITGRRFCRKLSFFDLYFADEDGDIVNTELGKDKQDTAMTMIKKMSHSKNIIPICAVGHVDEKISHIHFLYYTETGSKRNPCLEEILMERGKKTSGQVVQK